MSYRPGSVKTLENGWAPKLIHTGRRKGHQKIPDPTPEQIEKWASQGVPRKQMAKKLGMSAGYLNQKIQESRDLIVAELRGKLKFYE